MSTNPDDQNGPCGPILAGQKRFANAQVKACGQAAAIVSNTWLRNTARAEQQSEAPTIPTRVHDEQQHCISKSVADVCRSVQNH